MIFDTTTSERDGMEEREEEHDGIGQRCECGGGKEVGVDVEGRPGGAEGLRSGSR
jgi:hypothetical protein